VTISTEFDPGPSEPESDMTQAQVEPTDAAKKSYYQGLVENDILTILQPLMARRGYRMRWGDGRLKAEFAQATEGPWHYVRMAHGLDCYLWHSVYHEVASKVIRKPFVPSPCLTCFKTVVRPANLAGAFGMVELQQGFPFACKTGRELRPYTSGVWGSYHYGQGLAEGLEMYKHVKAAVAKHEDLGPSTPVILKRGCTEFERSCGPSENWTSTPAQRRLERLIDASIEHVPNVQPMPPHLVVHVHRRWIEWACQLGDMSYLRWTGNVPIHRGVTTYHHLADPANLPQDVGGGWWLFQGKKYKRSKLPKQALANEKLRQTGAGLPLQR